MDGLDGRSEQDAAATVYEPRCRARCSSQRTHALLQGVGSAGCVAGWTAGAAATAGFFFLPQSHSENPEPSARQDWPPLQAPAPLHSWVVPGTQAFAGAAFFGTRVRGRSGRRRGRRGSASCFARQVVLAEFEPNVLENEIDHVHHGLVREIRSHDFMRTRRRLIDVGDGLPRRTLQGEFPGASRLRRLSDFVPIAFVGRKAS